MLWLVGCAVVWALSVTAALAEDKGAAADHRAAACAQDAKGVKLDERERFVAACLKGHEGNGYSTHGVHSQQEKMKTCNQEARERDLHGDERRAFMSSCLRG
jgi:hypothetical protein